MSKDISSLKFMYNMERFATQIYKTQRGAFKQEEIIKRLVAAADNEQQHVDILQKRIIELHRNKSRIGFLFQTAGRILGLVVRIFGKVFVLKTDVWVEKRAVKDYRGYLDKIKFDRETIALIERIILDEQRHIETWENSIKMLKGIN
jgi:bacterioferritin